jgi:hypothetical protein
VHRQSHSEGKLKMINCDEEKAEAASEVANRRKRAHRSLDESHKKKVGNLDKLTEKALLPKRHVRYGSLRENLFVYLFVWLGG